MTEVEKFFRRLVSTLAASSPARLQGPLLLDDITGSILPYRTHRRALELGQLLLDLGHSGEGRNLGPGRLRQLRQ